LKKIFSSLIATRNLIESLGLRPLLLLEDAALEDFKDMDISEPLNAVVVGLAPSRFDYDTMNKAFRILKSGGKLISVQKGNFFQPLVRQCIK
jgi:hypothetical protein